MLRRPIFYVPILVIIMFCSTLQATGPDQQQKRSGWLSALLSERLQKETEGNTWQPVSSEVIRHMQPPHFFSVDIKGQPYLSLVANDGGDGISCDHAIWADAKLICADGTEVWLDTLKPVQAKVRSGKFFTGKKGKQIADKTFQRHIWAQANSEIVYRLDPEKNYTTFQAYAGIDNKSCGGSVKFIVHNKFLDSKTNALHFFWKPLLKDFPDDSTMILSARDWMRRDKLKIDSQDSDFEKKTKDTLEFAKKTLAYVEKSADRSKLKTKLKNLEDNINTGGNWRKLYIDICKLRREIIFSHPALDFEKILINVNPPTKYSHNGDQHLGRHSRIGPGLTILSDWKTENLKARAILEGKLPEGAVRNPDLHYDAEKVVFSFCDHTAEGEKRYFLYEAAIDGSWVRQLTGTVRDKFKTWNDRATVIIEDNDGCYLPDGNIIFISTRSQTFGRCHGGRYNPAWVLHKCDANGDNITQMSFGNENEYEPAVLNDGRIIFTRWEYTNRHEMLFHKLWWCRLDGTNVSHYFGNDMIEPMAFIEASPIPGTHKVVTTAQGHHSYNTGTTVVLDINKGENTEDAIEHITPETPYSETYGWPEPHYSHPYPVNEELFLVSRANHPVHRQRQTPPPADRGIYLIDPVGGRELIYENPDVASFSPIAVRKRQRPPVMPEITSSEKYGTVFLQNAYLTRNDPNGVIKPGMIKALRVNALGVQPRAKRAKCSMTVPNEIPKKVLGTTPLNEDGSAFFKVPANTSVQMQILDENGMAILTEKSLFYLQPGENRSCVGCHEPAGTSPLTDVIARNTRRTPKDLTPPAGPQYPGGLSFMRTVQPVLDRYCIGCHGLGEGDTENVKKANNINLVHDGAMQWPRSFRQIVQRGNHRFGDKGYMGGEIGNEGGERNISTPYEDFAYGNKVAHMLVKNHGNCNMDQGSYMRIIEWLDLNAQCYGDLFPNRLEERKIDEDAMGKLREYAKELFGEKIAEQPERALINTAQPDESRILMMPLPKTAGGWGQVEGYKNTEDEKYKKMAKMVDKCIIKSKNENTKGWEPTIEAGAGEYWVIKSRKEYLQKVRDNK